MDRVKTSADVSSLSEGALLPRPPGSGGWTAPTAAFPAPPSDASAEPDSVSELQPGALSVLDELVHRIDGVRGAIVASVDGFGIARSSSMADEAAHPAMLAAALGLSHQLVAIGGGHVLRQLVVDHDGGLMLVWPIGSSRVLAVLSESTVDQRRLRAFVRSRTTVLSGGTA